MDLEELGRLLEEMEIQQEQEDAQVKTAFHKKILRKTQFKYKICCFLGIGKEGKDHGRTPVHWKEGKVKFEHFEQ